MKIKKYINKFNPCMDSVEFLNKFDTFEEAWETCHRGDWMLSAASLLNVDIKILTLAKVECVETVKHLMRDRRSLKALNTARKFSKGEATREELAAAAAYAAAAAAHADNAASYAAYVAYAAAYAAAAAAAYATAAAAAAAYAADAAHAHDAADAAHAHDAADDADADAAKIKNQKLTSDICRKVLTKAVLENLKLLEIEK